MKRLLVLLCLLAVPAQAAELRVVSVADGVHALVGPLGPRSPENLGNNSTHGVIETADGLVLIDSGAGTGGAKAIEAAIRTFSDKPVVKVINSGGQDHRWLGNGYFAAEGAEVIAAAAAVADQKARVGDQLFRLRAQVGDALMTDTEPAFATRTFDEALDLTVGGVRMELRHEGHAHTAGDTYIWLPEKRVMFSGDIVYVGRMLGVNSHSQHKSWMAVYDAMAAHDIEVLVPGHGAPTDMATAKAQTRDYLQFLRDEVGKFIDDGGDITRLGEIDQSRFAHLKVYDLLKGRNIQTVFEQMEWED